MSPQSGPPGTVVTLRSTNMPAITPVRIGVGALRFGFEEVAQVMTTNRGVLSTTVEVPEWAQRDLIHRFIVFDFYFNPIALSDIFHVTDADGMVVRRGELTAGGVECPALRGDDGVLYTLTGDLAEFKAGDEVIVEGTLPEMSICMQGTTIQVARIEQGGGSEPLSQLPHPSLCRVIRQTPKRSLDVFLHMGRIGRLGQDTRDRGMGENVLQ